MKKNEKEKEKNEKIKNIKRKKKTKILIKTYVEAKSCLIF